MIALGAAAEQGENGGGGGGPLRQMIRRRMMERMKEQRASAGTDNSGAEPHSLNALDYYGTWKLFDALEDAAFYGKEREYALGNTPQQRNMGKWSDGVPVKEMIVEVGHADPNAVRIRAGGGGGFLSRQH
jgi:hypothetical protein